MAPRKVPQPCEHCGVEFKPRQRGALRQRFCSRACAGTRRPHHTHRFVKHGLSYTPLYGLWESMRQRCLNPKNRDFPNYGGRGITICARWDDCAAFVADIGPRPSPQHTLDRIDNDGHYEPGNVQWATIDRQLRNQRRARLLTFRGETLCLTDWAHRFGLTRACLHARLKAGWTLESAFLKPRQEF